MRAEDLRNLIGTPAWKIAMLLDAALLEERARENYGFSMVSTADVETAQPQSLDGLLVQLELRKKMTTVDINDHLLADAS